MIKNILFDMGGVLVKFDRHFFIARLGVSAEDEELLMRHVFLSREWAQMDRGSLTDTEASKLVCARLPERLHEAADKLVSMWERPIISYDGMDALIGELKENGYRIYLLSNASYRQHDYWPTIPESRYFDDTLISADVHLVKPQPEIYLEACRKFGIRASESVFIDDTPINVEGAYYTGMDGIVFHGDTAEIREELRKRGVKLQ